MTKAMCMTDPKRKTRIYNGHRYHRIHLDTETNENLKHEAMVWYPSHLWVMEKFSNLDIGNTFIVSLSEWDSESKKGKVYKMYSHF